MIRIREEHPEDLAAVRRINEEAFGQPQEAELADALRRSCPDLLSLVATEGNRPVGHILFSPAAIFPDPPAAYPGADTDHPALPRGLALGPMAVLPARQRRGIGSALVRRGLSLARATGAAFVIVLGHPGFYPRFGFQPAAPLGIRCQWEGVPEEAFMIRVLDSRAMAEVTGTARYREEFDAAV